MSTSKAGTDGKLSFAFGASGTSKPAAPAAGAGGGSGAPGKPMSNMEALLAKAKAKNNGTPNNGKSTAPPKKVPPKSIFGDDDEDDAGPSSAGLASARAGGSRTGRPDILSAPSLPNPSTADSSRTTAANLSRGATRAISSALALDPAAFAYDEVYDNLKAGEAAREAQRKAEAAERAPKYIDSFLASAETRRLDKLRAEEKMLAREREKEGGEFDDKEKFVTEGYKKQMEEVRKAEEEEKKREEAMRKSGKGPGLTAFYKTILETKTTGHDAVVASAQAHGNAGPSLAIRPPTEAQPVYEPADEYDPTLDRQSSSGGPARGAIPAGDDAPSTSTASVRAGLRPGTGSTSTAGRGGSGRLGPTLGPMLHDDTPEEANGAGDSDDDDDTKVQINDDGEVVNKRTLLRAGLNITKKPLSGSSHLPLGASGGAARGQAYVSRAVGTAASYKDRMERERQRLADNMRLEAERRRQEEEERYREEEEAARRRREGDDGQAEARRKEAKERYLERKRKAAEGKNGEKDKGKEEEAKRAKI